MIGANDCQGWALFCLCFWFSLWRLHNQKSLTRVVRLGVARIQVHLHHLPDQAVFGLVPVQGQIDGDLDTGDAVHELVQDGFDDPGADGQGRVLVKFDLRVPFRSANWLVKPAG